MHLHVSPSIVSSLGDVHMFHKVAIARVHAGTGSRVRDASKLLLRSMRSAWIDVAAAGLRIGH
jgi:hypothetical protein